MNIVTLLHNLRDAIHDHAATKTWCTSTYGRNQHVYVGIDTRNPPADTEYPLVSVFPIRKDGGYDAARIGHVIGVTCGIEDANMLATGKTDAVEYRGVGYVETFREYVETAVAAVDTGDIFISSLLIEYEPIEFFPFFFAAMQFAFTDALGMGDGAFD